MKLRTLDLFSGIGGFSLGLESTGFFETIGFVEKDKFCQKVLKKHWSNINIEEDIRNVKGEKYQADVVTGGFPCQPFSVAGKRKSTADDRYLWDEMLRVIRETKPRWVIGENVEGIVNINEGMVLRQVLNDLEKEGFKSQCIIIPASGIGAWHQRKRIWIMAYSDSNRHVSEIRRGNGEEKRIPVQDREKDSTSRQSIGTSDVWQTNKEYVPNTSSQRQFTRNNREVETKTRDKKGTGDQSSFQTLSSCSDVHNTNTGFSIRENKEIQSRGNAITNGSEDVSNSNSVRHGGWSSEGCTNTEWSFLPREQEGCKMGSEVERCNRDVPNTSVKGLQGCSIQYNLEGEQRSEEFTTKTSSQRQQTWWETQSELCGIPNGISHELDKDRSNRIKSLGNSIVPQIARQIGLSIMEAELNGKI
jgi:DNA (cytosine-5)-methyltransferase 1